MDEPERAFDAIKSKAVSKRASKPDQQQSFVSFARRRSSHGSAEIFEPEYQHVAACSFRKCCKRGVAALAVAVVLVLIFSRWVLAVGHGCSFRTICLICLLATSESSLQTPAKFPKLFALPCVR